MGINFDELKNKAQDALKEHGDKVEQGLDKAAGFAKSKFGHEDQIDSATGKARDFLNKQDDNPDAPPEQPRPPAQ